MRTKLENELHDIKEALGLPSDDIVKIQAEFWNINPGEVVCFDSVHTQAVNDDEESDDEDDIEELSDTECEPLE